MSKPVEAPRSQPSDGGPTFLGIGLQKAGTRWLYEQLRAHPGCWMPPLKELHFFDQPFPSRRSLAWFTGRVECPRDAYFVRRLAEMPRARRHSFAAYRSLFAPAAGRVTGDITPAYSGLEEEVIAEIADALPHLRIVLMLRDPITRVWSQLNDMANKGKFPRQDLSSVAGVRRAINLDNVDRVSYPARTFRRWSAAFPRQSFGVFFLEDVAQQPDVTRAAILRFLGADPNVASGGVSASHNSKSGRYRMDMPSDVRSFLVDTFAEEIASCAEIFGGRALDWARRYDIKCENNVGLTNRNPPSATR